MRNRRAILTGAYGVIGRAIAEGLALARYQLTLVGRDEAKLKELSLSLSDDTGDYYVDYHVVDLGDRNDVEAFAGSWNGPLHLLVNNAATAPRTRQQTPDGTEVQWAVNVLGYFWMMEYFHPRMKSQDDARIVNVCSYWAGDLDISDVEFRRRPYNNDTAYRQSKQAGRMLSAWFADRLAPENIAVLAAHPGDVVSGVSTQLGYGGSDSPRQAAETPLYCAMDPALRGVSGKYFENMREVADPFTRDKVMLQRVYDLCAGY